MPLFEEPKCRTMAAIGIGSLALGAASFGLQASGALAPTSPNLASSSAAISNAQASMLPLQRQLEALAATGGSGMIDMPTHYQTQQFLSVPVDSSYGAANGAEDFATAGIASAVGSLFGGTPHKLIPYNPADWAEGGQYFGQKLPGKIITKQVKIPAGPQKVDFTGMGQADIQKAIANRMAQVGLDLSKKYDSQFIDEALKEQQLANPEGTAARKKEYDLIQQQINNHPDQPVADTLNKQVSERLNAGKGLDEFDQGVLNDSVSRASADRGGNIAPNADFSQPLTTGAAGNARQMQGIQQADSWLSSGMTPEDVDYRREQQDLANLSSFAGGRTPESEFASLSGAQSGPTPMTNGQPLPTTQGNPTIAASGAAGSTFGQLQSQANPWLGGLSAMLNAGNTVANVYSNANR